MCITLKILSGSFVKFVIVPLTICFHCNKLVSKMKFVEQVVQTWSILLSNSRYNVIWMLPICLRNLIKNLSQFDQIWKFVFAQVLIYILFFSVHSTMTREKLTETVMRKRFYEKKWQERRRLEYEEFKGIYNKEMARRISLLSRTNRKEPWPV